MSYPRERSYRGFAKPPSPVLRTDHPLAAGLAGAWSFVPGTVVDLAGSSGMVPHSLAGEFGPNGLAVTASGSNQIALTGTDIFTGTEIHTLVLLYRDASAGTDYPGLFATGMGGTWKGFGILRTPTGDGNKIYCEVASGSLTLQTYSQVASNTGADGSWRVAAMTYDGATLIQYDNGIEVARNTGATGALSIQGGLSIGGRLDSASAWTRWAGGASLGYWWQGRALRAGEIAEVSADPFALIRPRRVAYFVDAGGGAASGTLAATLGALTASASATNTATGITPDHAGNGSGRPVAGDTLSAVATSRNNPAASLSSTLGALTVSATATSSSSAASGSLSATLGTLTLSATATNRFTGSLTSTLGTLTVSASATSVNNPSGTLAATLGAVTLSGAATATTPGNAAGSLSATLGTLAASATATSRNNPAGTLAATLGALTASASATSTGGASSASLSSTLGALTLSASATITGVPSSASLAATLGTLTVSAAATSSGPAGTASGTLAATLGGLTIEARAWNGVSVAGVDLFSTLVAWYEANVSGTADALAGGLWADAPPPGAALPLGVLDEVGRADLYGILDTSGGQRRVAEGSFQLRVHAHSRALARSLAMAIARRFEVASEAGQLSTSEADHRDLRRDGIGTSSLDPEKGIGGRDVWTHTVVFNYLQSESD
jgi:hypothetical protein